MLKGAGKAFHFLFVAELAELAYSCGLELSKIERKEGSTELDALSREHLLRAAKEMRQLLTILLAAGLTMAIVETARQSSVTLSPPRGVEEARCPHPQAAEFPRAAPEPARATRF